MSTASAETEPTNAEATQGLTDTELDDLIWDLAVGRPTRVILDTAGKRAEAAAVREQIDGAVGKRRVIEMAR